MSRQGNKTERTFVLFGVLYYSNCELANILTFIVLSLKRNSDTHPIVAPPCTFLCRLSKLITELITSNILCRRFVSTLAFFVVKQCTTTSLAAIDNHSTRIYRDKVGKEEGVVYCGGS